MAYDLRAEEARLKALLETALTAVKEAMSSLYWSYTKEYRLGKLDVARAILSSELEKIRANLEPISKEE